MLSLTSIPAVVTALLGSLARMRRARHHRASLRLLSAHLRRDIGLRPEDFP